MDKLLQIRAMFQPSSLNEKERSVDVVLSTEKAVDIHDWDRGRISEILLASGAEFSEQMPLLDSHSRYSVEDVIGSLRNIHADGNSIIAKAYFGETQRSIDAFKLVQQKHLTDVSIGYRVLEANIAEKGQTIQVGNRSYSATDKALRVVTKYKIYEGSLTPIGANDEAKVRSKGEEMDKDDKKQEIKTDPVPAVVVPTPEKKDEARNFDLESAKKLAVEEERKRISEINIICRQFEVDPEPYIARGDLIEKVKFSVLDLLASRRKPGIVPSIEVVKDATEKTREYVSDCLNLRMGLPVQGKDATKHSMLDLVRIMFESAGINVRNLTRQELAHKCFERRYSHSTSDFPLLLENSINKRLKAAYQEAPSTYQLWCNVVEVPDFKEVSVVRVSEFPDLDLVPEGKPFPEKTMSESRETYSLDTYGDIFAVTWQALVNDDLGGFNKVATQQGYAGKRKVNALAYAVVTANANLSDGVPLFHATHKNLAGSSAALSHDTLALARAAMRTQTGPQGAILNIEPAYLIVPAAKETIAKQLVGSEVVPGTNQGHSLNTFYKTLTPVPEGILDINSTVSWYLACRWQQCDTVEVAFLEGMREPFLDETEGFEIAGRKYLVKLPCVAKAIDHHGMYKNAGA